MASHRLQRRCDVFFSRRRSKSDEGGLYTKNGGSGLAADVRKPMRGATFRVRGKEGAQVLHARDRKSRHQNSLCQAISKRAYMRVESLRLPSPFAKPLEAIFFSAFAIILWMPSQFA
jgi:ribosomal protein L34